MTVMKKNFDSDMIQELLDANHWFCGMPDCTKKADDIHHIVPNTKANNVRFPLFVQSPFNALPICRHCHANAKKPKVTDSVATMYENWLQRRGDEKSVSQQGTKTVDGGSESSTQET